MLAFFVLFLGICVLDTKARDSANIWGGLFVTDLANTTVNVDKLYTSLADRGLADVFNRLVIVQRGHDGRHFIKSHGSFRTLSRGQDRPLSVSKKEFLPWLLKEEANVIICVADSKADVPQMLISAQRKGMFPSDTKLMIWMIQGDVMSADGMKIISLISPGDFDRRSSSLDNEDRFTSRNVRLISAKNLESAVIELFQKGMGNVHHRERRNVGQSVTPKVPSSSPAVGQSVSNSMTAKASSSAVGRSVSSSMANKVSSSSFSVGQSVSSPVTTNVMGSNSSPVVVQSVSSSVSTKVSIPSSRSAVGLSASSSLTTKLPILSSSPAIVQPVSSSETPRVSIPSSSSAFVRSLSSTMTTKISVPSSSPAFDQSVSSSISTKVPSSSPVVVQSVSISLTIGVSGSSPAFGQSVSISMTTKVSTPSSSPVVVQPVSSSMTINVPVPSSSPAVGQSVSSSITTKLSIPSSSSVSQSMSSSITTKVSIPGSRSAVSQSVSRSMTTIPEASSSSPVVVQPVFSSMTINVPVPSSSPAVGQSVSSSITTKLSIPSSSSAVSQSMSSSITTKVSIPGSSSAVSQFVSSSMSTKVSRLSSSPAVGQTVSSSLTSQVVAPSSSAPTASVVSSPVGQSTSVPVTTKVTTPTASLSVSPSISSFVAVRPTGSESRSSAMVFSSFTETQATTLTVHVPIKPSSSVSSSSSSLFSSSLPSESLKPSSTSGQKSSVATTLQPIVSSSLPVISTPLTPRRSVETSATPLRVFSSSMTSGSARLSTSVVILPTSTKREPLPSSSSEVVTEKPPVYENETIVIEFEGNCEDVVGNKKTEEKFRQEFAREVTEKLGVSETAIVVKDIVCGSIRVTFTISGTSGKANVSQVLKNLVDNGNISVTVDNKTFRASKLEVVRPTAPSTLAPTTEGKKSEIAFILYIAFGALMAFIFIVGFIVLVVRCRKDRREGSFAFPSDLNYELRRFHGIPHLSKNYSRVDYYGEPVEKDAAAADPDADDEFQAGAGGDPYDVRAPTGGRAVASNRSDAKEENFNVGAMGMPEWKNLPKLSVKEVAVAEPSEGIPKSSGSVGSRQLLLDDESPQEDLRHAYENPVVTFGDGPTDVEKEDS